jgi:hypothetical protein
MPKDKLEADVTRTILIQDILTSASKTTILGWFAGLAWLGYFSDPGLGFFGWMLIIVGGMFAASIILGGGVALAIAGVSKAIAGRADAMPGLFKWGRFVSGVLAFLAARPAAEQLAALMN